MTLQLTELPDLGTRPPRVRAQLTGWQRMDVETARKLIVDLEGIDAGQLAGPLGAFWAGRLEAAVRNLLEILDAVAIP